ncbi:hypothetical protein [Agrobacterium tumefaciens]|uniref:hypothetical protein n=1 Tax=Agrobacterium tumefaciens TaxID=358 RepID=UPI00287EA736|nr:hypothetical protein [Agrobacterium tumefaciens]MDS7595479.1 hypothetical protein [Agrobacterium tumefaciens]
MKAIAVAATAVLLASPSYAVEPIPGSITYKHPAPIYLLKSPVGSKFYPRFAMGNMKMVETYEVQADHSIKLISRTVPAGLGKS